MQPALASGLAACTVGHVQPSGQQRTLLVQCRTELRMSEMSGLGGLG